MDKDRWQKLGIQKQLGHITSEFSRARSWEAKKDKVSRNRALERALDLNRESRERVAERVLEREAHDDGTHRGGGEELLTQEDSSDHAERAEDDRVLEDRGKPLWDPIGAQRVDEDDNREVDSPEREEQLIDREALRLDLGVEPGGGEQAAQRHVRGEQRNREPQLAVDQAVRAGAAKRGRERQEREADDQMDRVAGHNAASGFRLLASG